MTTGTSYSRPGEGQSLSMGWQRLDALLPFWHRT